MKPEHMHQQLVTPTKLDLLHIVRQFLGNETKESD